MQVGGLKVPLQAFGEATEVLSPKDLVSDKKLDGILGMGLQSTLLDSLKKFNLIERRVFSVYLNETGGELILGGSDPALFEPPMTYVPLSSKPNKKWQFTVDGISVNSLKLCKGGCEAILDTGSYVTSGPEDEIEALVKKIGGFSAQNDGKFYVNCKRVQKLPNITFRVGGTQFKLSPRQYIIEVSHRLDSFGEIGHFHNKFQEKRNSCRIGFKAALNAANEHHEWKLGNLFLRQMYSEHDLDKEQIGLAWAKTSDSSSFD